MEENLNSLGILCHFASHLHPNTCLSCCLCELPLSKRGNMKHCTSRRTEDLAGWGAAHPRMPQPTLLPFCMVLTKHKQWKPAHSGSYALAAGLSKALVQYFQLMGSREEGSLASLGRRMAQIKTITDPTQGLALRLGICFRNYLIWGLQLTLSQCYTAILLAPWRWQLPPIPASLMSVGRESVLSSWTIRQQVQVCILMPYNCATSPAHQLLAPSFSHPLGSQLFELYPPGCFWFTSADTGNGSCPSEVWWVIRNPSRPSDLKGLLLLASLMPMAGLSLGISLPS